jgi:hypothetical protein
LLVDTDGDGYSDKEEIDQGFNPLDANSHPRKLPVWTIVISSVGGVILLGWGSAVTFFVIQKKK